MRISLSTCFSFLTILAFSQSLGVTASYNLGFVKPVGNNDYFKPMRTPGYSYGLYYEQPLFKYPRFNIGIGLERMGYSFGYKTTNPSMNNGVEFYYDIVAIPMDIKYGWNIFKSTQAGFSGGIHPTITTAGPSTGASYSWTDRDSIVEESTIYPHPINFLLDAGVYLKINSTGRITISGQYGFTQGLVPVLNADITHYSNSTIQDQTKYTSRGGYRYFKIGVSYRWYKVRIPSEFEQD